MTNILYIASNSSSRKTLLQQAQIPFYVIFQDADESHVNINQPLQEIVMQLAVLKMEHAHISCGNYEGEIRFVLTADTLSLTRDGRILTKPIDKHDAISMLYDTQFGTLTATGFCLRKLQWWEGDWNIIQQIVDYDQAESIFYVPNEFIDFYLDAIPFLNVSGAISIEGIGGQFLQSVHGNYEAIIGLPMFKIRQALCDLGFYKN